MIELFLGFVFVLLHFEMELVIRLGNLFILLLQLQFVFNIVWCLAAKKRKEKIKSLISFVILFYFNLKIKI